MDIVAVTDDLSKLRSGLRAWQQLLDEGSINHNNAQPSLCASPTDAGGLSLVTRAAAAAETRLAESQLRTLHEKELTAIRDGHQAALQTLQQDVENLRSEIADRDVLVDCAERRCVQLAAQLDELKKKHYASSAHRAEEKAELHHAASRVERVMNEVGQWKADVEAWNNILLHLDEEKTACASALLKAQSSVAASMATTKALEAKCCDLESTVAVLQKECDGLRCHAAELSAENNELKAHHSALVTTTSETKKRLTELVAQDTTTVEALRVSQASLEEALSHINVLETEVEIARSGACSFPNLDELVAAAAPKAVDTDDGNRSRTLDTRIVAEEATCIQKLQQQVDGRLMELERELFQMRLAQERDSVIYTQCSATEAALAEEKVRCVQIVTEAQRKLAEVEPESMAAKQAAESLQVRCESLEKSVVVLQEANRVASEALSKANDDCHKLEGYVAQLRSERKVLTSASSGSEKRNHSSASNQQPIPASSAKKAGSYVAANTASVSTRSAAVKRPRVISAEAAALDGDDGAGATSKDICAACAMPLRSNSVMCSKCFCGYHAACAAVPVGTATFTCKGCGRPQLQSSAVPDQATRSAGDQTAGRAPKPRVAKLRLLGS